MNMSRLIVGVPLLELGKVESHMQEIKLVDPFGRETSQTTNLAKEYLVTLNANRYLIGSNEDSIIKYGAGVVTYTYEGLHAISDNKWHLYKDSNMNAPGRVVIGLMPQPLDGMEPHCCYQYEDVQLAMSLLGNSLKENFGYNGKIYLMTGDVHRAHGQMSLSST